MRHEETVKQCSCEIHQYIQLSRNAETIGDAQNKLSNFTNSEYFLCKSCGIFQENNPSKMYDIFPCFSYTNYMTLFQALGFQFKVAEKEICKLNRLNKIVMSISELNIHLRKIFCLIVVSKNHSLDCLLKPLMYALRRLI